MKKLLIVVSVLGLLGTACSTIEPYAKPETPPLENAVGKMLWGQIFILDNGRRFVKKSKSFCMEREPNESQE
jgi:hypothetical protein